MTEAISIPSQDKTVFFVKPYIPLDKAKEIINYRNYLLRLRGVGFTVLESFSTIPLPKKFWQDFYRQIAEEYPNVFKDMVYDFSNCSSGILGDVLGGLEGKAILEPVRKILGPRQIDIAPHWTIRRRYGKLEREGKGHRTVAHASTYEEVDKDLRVLVEYEIISL